MAISRKSKTFKKSLKFQKRSKNVKAGKSKTRKHIRKMKGGSFNFGSPGSRSLGSPGSGSLGSSGSAGIVTKPCYKSIDCFDEYTAGIIKMKMREYLRPIDKKRYKEDEIKKQLYPKLYSNLQQNVNFNFIKGKILIKNHDNSNNPNIIGNAVNNILQTIIPNNIAFSSPS